MAGGQGGGLADRAGQRPEQAADDGLVGLGREQGVERAAVAVGRGDRLRQHVPPVGLGRRALADLPINHLDGGGEPVAHPSQRPADRIVRVQDQCVEQQGAGGGRVDVAGRREQPVGRRPFDTGVTVRVRRGQRAGRAGR